MLAFRLRAPKGLGILQFLEKILLIHVGVSKKGGTPKWMVYKGKPY